MTALGWVLLISLLLFMFALATAIVALIGGGKGRDRSDVAARARLADVARTRQTGERL